MQQNVFKLLFFNFFIVSVNQLLLVNSTFALLGLLAFGGFCDVPGVLDTFTGLVGMAYFSQASRSFGLAAGGQMRCCGAF